MFPKETWISLALMAVTSAALMSFLGCAHHATASAQPQYPQVRTGKVHANSYMAQHHIPTPAAHVRQAIAAADPHAPVLRPLVQNGKPAKKKSAKLSETSASAR